LYQHAIQLGLEDGDAPERQYYQLYGDSAHGVSPVLVSVHARIGDLTDTESVCNMQMGGVRISVEHSFGLMLQHWPFLQCFWKQQILGTACGLW
jgi:hypothetical protein